MSHPHVAKWWKGERTLDEVRERYRPRIAGESEATPYRGVLGIDLFIADAEDLGRGLGTGLVRQFVQFLFADPTVHRIQVDPRPDNRAAIRCYEKVGFRRDAEITTPDGPALLMVLERRSLVNVPAP
jgi:RimJ/RimL family protein N-acetyltransferase